MGTSARKYVLVLVMSAVLVFYFRIFIASGRHLDNLFGLERDADVGGKGGRRGIGRNTNKAGPLKGRGQRPRVYRTDDKDKHFKDLLERIQKLKSKRNDDGSDNDTTSTSYSKPNDDGSDDDGSDDVTPPPNPPVLASLSYDTRTSFHFDVLTPSGRDVSSYLLKVESSRIPGSSLQDLYEKWKPYFWENYPWPESHLMENTLRGRELALEQVKVNLDSIKYKEMGDGTPYPGRPLIQGRDKCDQGERFNEKIMERKKYWVETLHGEGGKWGVPWSFWVNDKLGGGIFAKAMGVKVPRVVFCSGEGAQGLKNFKVGKNKDKAIVVKNKDGFSTLGTYIFPDGVNREELLRKKKMSMNDVIEDLEVLKPNAKTVYAEEMVRGPDHAIPHDYKFYMMGDDTVGGIGVVFNRGTERECCRFMDEKWRPLDMWGCFNRADVDDVFSRYNACNDDGPKPPHFEDMVKVAKKLGKALKVFMRVDLFIDSEGDVVLGEFTPWPMNGKYHCVAGHWKDDEHFEFDNCYLAKLWNRWENRIDGGDVGEEVPKWVEEFLGSETEQERCQMAVDVHSGKRKAEM